MGVPIKYPRTPIKYQKTLEAGARHIGGVREGPDPRTTKLPVLTCLLFLCKTIHFRSPNGGGSKVKTPASPNCRSSVAIPKQLLFFCKTIHFRSPNYPNGGGSRVQTPAQRNYRSSLAILKPLLFQCKTIHFRSPNGGGSGSRPPHIKITSPHLPFQNHCFSFAKPYMFYGNHNLIQQSIKFL